MKLLSPSDAGKDWHDCRYESPVQYGIFGDVECYRPDGQFGWHKPKRIRLTDYPALNANGLMWRAVPA